MNRQASILACTARELSHETLAMDCAELLIALSDLSARADSLSHTAIQEAIQGAFNNSRVIAHGLFTGAVA